MEGIGIKLDAESITVLVLLIGTLVGLLILRWKARNLPKGPGRHRR